MTEQRKPDLSQIEPIGKVPNADDALARGSDVDRIGRTAASISGAPVAVGVDETVTHREIVDREPEPRTSPETEEQLEQLRRG
jgi:hypothetical protein